METITPNTKDIEGAIRTILAYIGEDPDREGLVGTPDRIVRMYKEIFRGYDEKQKPKMLNHHNFGVEREIACPFGFILKE